MITKTSWLKYTGDVMYAFNSNYVVVSGYSGNTAIITIGSHTIKASLYGSQTKIYISKLLQLLWTDPINESKGKTSNIVVSIAGSEISSTISNVFVIWGSLQLSDCINGFGVFEYQEDNGVKYYTRTVRWYRKFPFSIGIMGFSGSNRTDARMVKSTTSTSKVTIESMTIESTGFYEYTPAVSGRNNDVRFEVTLTDNYATKYDFLFMKGVTKMKTIGIPCDDEVGYYLRWVDKYGFMQYFLFSKGTIEDKVTAENAVDADITYSGNIYGDGKRYVKKESTQTIKCCATRLTREEWRYVHTVFKSIIVDLFRGYDSSNNPIWEPVTVDSGTFTKKDRDVMYDVEITVSTQNVVIQSL